MRILIFGDSLIRPRPEINASESTEYEDTYAYKLKKALAPDDDVEIHYVESLDTLDAIHWSERMIAFRRPDIVFFHLGINDCAPRIFKKNRRYFIFKRWFRTLSRDVLLKCIHKCRPYLIKYIVRHRVYVRPDEFKTNFHQMVNTIKNYSPRCKFYALSIAMPTSKYEYKSPGIKDNVCLYNEVLESVFRENYLDVDKILGQSPNDYLISDEVHLTKESHQKIYSFILEILARK